MNMVDSAGKEYSWIGTNVYKYDDEQLKEAEKAINPKWGWKQAVVQLTAHVQRLEKEIELLKRGQ